MSSKKLCALCGQLPAASSRHKYCLVNCDRQKAYRVKRRQRRVTSDDIIRELQSEVRLLREMLTDLAARPPALAAASVGAGEQKFSPSMLQRGSAGPTDDEMTDMLEVTEAKSEVNATENFIRSMLALQNM